MRRVLVTGGSGFIGSHVVDALRRAGIRPRVFDREPLRHHSPADVEAVSADLNDAKALDRALEGCEAVIHLAAAADVGIVAEHPRESEEVNSRGTIEVLEAARRAGGTRVVYGSTIWVYGASGDGLLDEDTSTRPASWRERCTAAPTRSSTACRRRSFASASPTGPAPVPRR